MKPNILSFLGENIVVVDDVQPVAALISVTGEVLDCCSWKSLVVQPSSWTAWPHRILFTNRNGDGVLVQERNCDATIQLEVSESNRLVATLAPAGSLESATAVARGRYSISRSNDAHEADGWDLRVVEEGGVWQTSLRDLTSQTEGRRPLKIHRTGAAVALLTTSDHAFSAIRVATKRPWTFDARHELLHLDRTSGHSTTVSLPDIALSDAWSPLFPDQLRSPELMTAIKQAVLDCSELTSRGAFDIAVRLDEMDTPTPRVVVRFKLPGRSEIFEREDQPFNHLGLHTGGLAGLSIFFGEDLDGDLLEHHVAGPGEVVRL